VGVQKSAINRLAILYHFDEVKGYALVIFHLSQETTPFWRTYRQVRDWENELDGK